MLNKARSNRTLPSSNRDFYRNVYLKSEHWLILRRDKLEKSPKCEICGTSSCLDVHHKEYRGLYDVGLGDLQTLCRICHTKIHDKKKKGRNEHNPDRRGVNRGISKRERSYQRMVMRNNKGRDIGRWINELTTSLKESRKEYFNTYISIHY